MDKIIVNQYIVNSPLISDRIRIAFISDIHSNEIALGLTSDIIKEFQIDILLIGGDIIDNNDNYIRNEMIKESLEEWMYRQFWDF